MVELIKKNETFVSQENGDEITFQQVYVVINGTAIKIKAVYKNDGRTLKALAELRED